jgi:putative flippase GtrA
MTADDRSRAAIVIPAYEPTPALLALVTTLTDPGAGVPRPIIVVDDGSSSACRETFLALAGLPGVVVLAHAVNLGKGQALKTAFNHFLLRGERDAPGVVTADADGQHLADDIRRVAERLEAMPSSLVLGSRSFEGAVPLRSRVGNGFTRAVFRLLLGRPIADTQTGLRGIPRGLLAELLQIEAGRYEFELEMLVRASTRRLPIEQVPIATVYGGDGQSHFNPLRDSLRIYFVFIRFLGLSMATSGLDFSVFALVYVAAHNILAATAIARAVAGTFNFISNRTLVFRSTGGLAREALKYALLVMMLMGVSYGLVTSLMIFAGLGVYASKLLAEGVLFAASFALQNLWVFPDREPGRGRADIAARGTDWNEYYRRPALFAPWTRRITGRGILRDLAHFSGGAPLGHVAELGGGNSAVLGAVRARFPDARLTAIDINPLGLRMLEARWRGDGRITAIEADVLTPVANPLGADVVFSVGLVEHFGVEDTARAIGAHFAHVKPDGLVLITFPTPTWLYRLARRAAEAAGVWAFPDERPLEVGEVTREMGRYGDVLGVRINWPIVLTQCVVVARRLHN